MMVDMLGFVVKVKGKLFGGGKLGGRSRRQRDNHHFIITSSISLLGTHGAIEGGGDHSVYDASA